MMVRLKMLVRLSEEQFLNIVTENIFSIDLGDHSEHLYPDRFSFDCINMCGDSS